MHTENRQRKEHITQGFFGGEKPFGKTTPPLQNLHNVLSSTWGYNTLAMQVQHREQKTPIATHSTNNRVSRIPPLRNPKNAYNMHFTFRATPKGKPY